MRAGCRSRVSSDVTVLYTAYDSKHTAYAAANPTRCDPTMVEMVRLALGGRLKELICHCYFWKLEQPRRQQSAPPFLPITLSPSAILESSWSGTRPKQGHGAIRPYATVIQSSSSLIKITLQLHMHQSLIDFAVLDVHETAQGVLRGTGSRSSLKDFRSARQLQNKTKQIQFRHCQKNKDAAKQRKTINAASRFRCSTCFSNN